MVLNCQMCGASLNVNKAINDVITCEYCDSATNIHGYIHLNMSSDRRAAALIKRGLVLIEFGVWDKAKYVLSKAVEYDPDNGKAYLGLLMVETKSRKEEDLSVHKEVLSDYESYQKALLFADIGLKTRLENYNYQIMEQKQQEEIMRKEQILEREKRKQEREIRVQKLMEAEEEEKEKRIENITMIVLGIVLLAIIIFIFQVVI